MNPVELEVEFGWTCPTCGLRNHTGGVPLEVTEDDGRVAFWQGDGLSDFVFKPARVKCGDCGVRYDVLEDRPIDFGPEQGEGIWR